MYQQIKIIEEAGLVGFQTEKQVIQQRDILAKKKYGKWYASIVNWNFDPIWQTTEMQNVGGIQIIDDFLMYIVNFEKTVFRNFADINHDTYVLNFAFTASKHPNNKNVIFGYFEDERFFVLDLNNNEILPYPNPKFTIWYVLNKYLIGTQHNASKLIISDHEFNTIWERDISIEGQHKHWMTWEKSKKDEIVPGRILSTILYQEKYVIICLEESDCICLELATGKEVWRNPNGSIWRFALSGNIAYCITNRSLWKLDLETGATTDYGWKGKALPDFEYEGNIFTPVVHDIQYHSDLLWFLSYDMSSGYSFILVVSPETGNYEWIHKVDSKHKVMSMKFHKNRMYLNSTRDLYIYERE